MLDTIRERRRQLMGWTGVLAIVVSLFASTLNPDDPNDHVASTPAAVDSSEVVEPAAPPQEPELSPMMTMELRIVLIALGIALICLALPRSTWRDYRNWWTTE